ncbi:phosphate ABC transporter permease PstA [Nocardioides cynanchi]|uniref:phosphate ABC transporter permease PstA n=1 Tax=Nocardioides cynanchi TaxID=2558918 RepID=UPI001246FDCB|nr:phosphate ABC transporter permease PstA [Nocardioides cynanchi]
MTSAPMTLSQARLPRWAPALIATMALAVAGLPALLAGWGLAAWLCLSVVVFLVAMPLWSRLVEGRRAAVDRLVTGLIWTAFAIAISPLVWLLWVVLRSGVPAINGDFLTYSMLNVIGDEQGGILHALIGTLLITVAAAVLSVPIGILTAVYLVEYGARSRIARIITFLVDVMTGIPSIVAGLFALALVVLLFGPAFRMGFGGSIALSLLMIPTVVRSSEEMFRLVPDDLREASYALGVPKWRTIVKVVLPTSVGGIVTGVVLAISRVIGETAPLLVVAGATDGINTNLFDGRMTTLPVFIFSQYSSSTPVGYQRAWGGALVLIALVMVLNLTARLIGRIFAPAKGH